jgi:D-aminoacyl-tRNA deacylase
MRAVIQRVSECTLHIDDSIFSQIGCGLLVLLGIEDADTAEDIVWLSGKITRLRIFPDSNGIMNLSVIESGGEVMIVSQFTLHASIRKGNRPSYIKAAGPDIAIPLYDAFIDRMNSDLGKKVATGSFGAHMKIQLINDGPVTIVIDTKNKE